MTGFVLDTSVTMRWFFDGGAHLQADAILCELARSSTEAVVPILWRYEVSAVLARAQSKGPITSRDVMDFLEDLEALPIRVDPDSGTRIFTDVHQLATRYGLTSYDAAYLELARRLHLPLATFDAELITACKRAGVLLWQPG